MRNKSAGVTCIATSTKAFNELCKSYNVQSGYMEMALKTWIDNKNTNTYNPKDPELIKYLGKQFISGKAMIEVKEEDYDTLYDEWSDVTSSDFGSEKDLMDTLNDHYPELYTLYNSSTNTGLIFSAVESFNDNGIFRACIPMPTLSTVEEETTPKKELTAEEAREAAFEQAMEPIESAIDYSNRHIKFDPETHTYTYYENSKDKKGTKIDCSVTQFRDYKKSGVNRESSQSLATLLGTKVDAMVRRYFSNDEKEKELSNKELSNSLYNDLKKSLVSLEKFLRKKYGNDCRIITDTFYMLGNVRDNDGNNISVAGSPDMVIVSLDKNNHPHYHLLDMKTARMDLTTNSQYNRNKLAGYQVQQNFYKFIFNTNFIDDEYSDGIEDMQLINIGVSYDSKSGVSTEKEMENLISNGKAKIDGVRLSKKTLALIDVEDMPLKDLIDSESELLAMKEEVEKTDDKNTEALKDVKEDTALLSLYNMPQFSKEELRFVAKNIMIETSKLLDNWFTMQSTPNINVNYDKLTREEFASVDGVIQQALRYIYSAFKSTDTDIEVMGKKQILLDNWDSLLKIGYPELIKLEGVAVSGSILSTDIDEDLGDDEALTAGRDLFENGEKQLESWQIEHYQISANNSLSRMVKGVLEKLDITDEDGNIYADDYGYGLATYMDANEVTNMMLKWFRNATSFEDMKKILNLMSSSNRWVSSLLYELNTNERFASQFYQGFRKDFTKYSVVTIERDKNNNPVYVTTIVNELGVAKGLLSDAAETYNSGSNKIFRYNDDFTVKDLNKKVFEDLESKIDSLNDSSDDDVKNRYTDTYSDNTIQLLSDVLQILGIHIDSMNLAVALAEDKQKANSKSLPKIVRELTKITAKLEKAAGENINPVDATARSKGGYIYNSLKKITSELAETLPEEIESSTYQDGKMYYSYITPSAMGQTMIHLSDNINTQFGIGIQDEGTYENYIDDKYGKYRFFKTPRGHWLNKWLSVLETTDGRRALDYKTQLSFDRVNYAGMGDLNYSLSLITEYFYNLSNEVRDFKREHPEEGTVISPKYAWFRMPTMSNKPAGEFIKFYTYSHEDIISGMHDVFIQEMGRIKDVLRTGGMDNAQRVKTFDIAQKTLDKNPELLEKLRVLAKGKKSGNITKEDMKLLEKTGANFKFLSFLNDEIQDNSSLLGKKILKILNSPRGGDFTDREWGIFDTIFSTFMDKRVKFEISKLSKLGLLDHTGIVDKIPNKKEKLGKYTYLESLTQGYEDMAELVKSEGGTYTKEDMLNQRLEDYIWNDMFATVNIIQLTVTDLAYFKNMTDFQKRFALVHSPGLRVNTEATYNGDRVSDGTERSVYIEDQSIISYCRENISTALQKAVDKEKDSHRRASAQAQMDLIMSTFNEVNVTDGEAYNCPTSFRKKAIMAGKWTDVHEDAYKRILNGEFNIDDITIMQQVMKPFVASSETVTRSYGDDSLIKVPVQHKNSEFMLFIADAIIRGSGKRDSKLAAIFDFMEESARTNPTRGIDTVEFVSAVKHGISGVVDISSDTLDYQETMDILKSNIYTDDSNYNSSIVHEIPFEDYCIQQEIPSHFFDGDRMIDGSQWRMLSVSDAGDVDFLVRNPDGAPSSMSKKELLTEYQNLVSENIMAAYESLRDRLQLTHGSKVEQNIAISKILKKAILKDQKYGPDLLRACSLDDDGKFVIPLCDPIQAVRVMQLLNSIVKNDINKQRKTGGPLVQVSDFGLSKDLNIRWYNKEGTELILTLKEYAEEQGLDYNDEKTRQRYKEYCNQNQGKLAYFEVYIPVPNTDLANQLRIKDEKNGGYRYMTIDEAIQAHIFSGPEDEKLKALGYRIPTEDKYSMAPMVVKGFLPKICGEAVMLPHEITALSGSDFDIDKLYVLLKNFDYTPRKVKRGIAESIVKEFLDQKAIYNIAKEKSKKSTLSYKEAIEIVGPLADRIKLTNDEVKKISPLYNKLIKTVIDYYGKGYSREEILGDEFSNGYNEREEFYDFFDESVKGLMTKGKEVYRESTSSENTDLSTKEGRDNRIFDLQWAVLTSDDTTDKMFNPGSFVEQKRVAYSMQIIRNEELMKKESIAEILKLSPKDMTKSKIVERIRSLDSDSLDDLKNELEASDINILFPSTQTYFHNQNMSGKVLIGIFANHIVSHAAMTMEKDIGNDPVTILSGGVGDFVLNGISLNGRSLDNLKGEMNKRVSKTIAGFLAASADIAKDPVLDSLGVNSATADIAMTMARLGFSSETIGLLLTTPTVQEIVNRYMRQMDDSSYATIGGVIDDILDSASIPMEVTDAYLSSMGESTVTSLNTDDLLNSTGMSGEILALMKRLSSIAKDVGELTYLTKFNSSVNSAGPTTTDTLLMQDRVNSFMTKVKSGVSTLSEEALHVIDNLPILKAFYETTVGPDGLATEIGRNYFPQASESFKRMLSLYSDITKNRLNVKSANKIINEFFYYCLTARTNPKVHGETVDDPVFDGSLENRVELLNFAQKISDFLEDRKYASYGDNALFKAMKYKNIRGTKVWVADFSLGGLGSEQKEEIKNIWSDMVTSTDPKVQEIGLGLFYYSALRNGLSFGPKTPMHLSSVDVKLRIPGYKEGLEGMTGNNIQQMVTLDDDSIMQFFIQYFRNHSADKTVVPKISFEKDSRVTATNDYKNISVVCSTGAPTYNKLFTLTNEGKEQPLVAINIGDNLYIMEKVVRKSNERMVTYVKTDPLGRQYELLEYDATDDSMEMKSAVSEIDATPETSEQEDPAEEINDGSSLEFITDEKKKREEGKPKTDKSDAKKKDDNKALKIMKSVMTKSDAWKTMIKSNPKSAEYQKVLGILRQGLKNKKEFKGLSDKELAKKASQIISTLKNSNLCP